MVDILIRGMEMPKDDRITIQIGADGAVYFVEKCTIMAEKYEKSSHAVPLPEGHGRLGDLDRLFEVMGQDADRWIVDEVSMIETDDVLDAIQNAPTIVPAEGVNDNDSEL